MRKVQQALKQARESVTRLDDLQDDIDALEDYLTTDWQDDYEADERGAISKAVDRGVLAQDTLYDLLEDIDEFPDNLL
jgi:hypothetical protein